MVPAPPSVQLNSTCDGSRQEGGAPATPIIGNVQGGLSGPAIKPIALFNVYQVAQYARRLSIPIIGQGGIATIEDAIELVGRNARPLIDDLEQATEQAEESLPNAEDTLAEALHQEIKAIDSSLAWHYQFLFV